MAEFFKKYWIRSSEKHGKAVERALRSIGMEENPADLHFYNENAIYIVVRLSHFIPKRIENDYEDGFIYDSITINPNWKELYVEDFIEGKEHTGNDRDGER